MLQRLALRLYRQMVGEPSVEWADMNEGARGIALGLARAALDELREPSEAMVGAGADEIDDQVGFERLIATDVWQAMIDAALLDAPEGEQGRA